MSLLVSFSTDAMMKEGILLPVFFNYFHIVFILPELQTASTAVGSASSFQITVVKGFHVRLLHSRNFCHMGN